MTAEQALELTERLVDEIERDMMAEASTQLSSSCCVPRGAI
jgi:hypothetical protein